MLFKYSASGFTFSSKMTWFLFKNCPNFVSFLNTMAISSLVRTFSNSLYVMLSLYVKSSFFNSGDWCLKRRTFAMACVLRSRITSLSVDLIARFFASTNHVESGLFLNIASTFPSICVCVKREMFAPSRAYVTSCVSLSPFSNHLIILDTIIITILFLIIS